MRVKTSTTRAVELGAAAALELEQRLARAEIASRNTRGRVIVS